MVHACTHTLPPYSQLARNKHTCIHTHTLVHTHLYTVLCTHTLTHPDPEEHQGVLQGHSDAIWDLAVHHKSGLLLSCSADGSVRLWNHTLTSPQVKQFDAEPGIMYCIAGDFVGERFRKYRGVATIHESFFTWEFLCIRVWGNREMIQFANSPKFLVSCMVCVALLHIFICCVCVQATGVRRQ